MWAMTETLGFHWVFFPSFCAEAIPQIDMFPSWVASVIYVVWQNKKQQEASIQSSPPRPLIDVQEAKAFGASLSARLTFPAPRPQESHAGITVGSPPPPPGAVEQRLKRLDDLREKNLISQAEYDTKREQVLADICNLMEVQGSSKLPQHSWAVASMTDVRSGADRSETTSQAAPCLTGTAPRGGQGVWVFSQI
jgi:hypothetical protein